MRPPARPTRPLLSAAAATALSLALVAGGMPAHAAGAPDATTADVPAPFLEAAVPEATPVEPVVAEGPAAAPTPSVADIAVPAPVVLTPAEGDEQVEGATTFSGTGLPGATVDISVFAAGLRNVAGDAADFLHYSALVGADGRWSTIETVPVGFWAYKADQSLGEQAASTSGNAAFTIFPAAPRITAPSADARVEGRLHVAGTGAAGTRTVVSIAGDDEPITATVPVGADGSWSTEVLVAAGAYEVTAIASHPLPYEREERYIHSAPTRAIPVTVTRAAQAVRPTLLTPGDGDSQLEGPTTFTGRGEPSTGITVLLYAEGDRGYPSDSGIFPLAETVVAMDGMWSVTAEAPIGIWVILVEQGQSGIGPVSGEQPVLTIVPPAPVITRPATDARVEGEVQLTGIGTAGSAVLLTLTRGTATRELTADVRADGTWSVAADIPSGRWTVSAVGSHLLPYERSERHLRSAASPTVAFQVSGGTVVTAAHRTALPTTGADPLPLLALTGSLLAAGIALLVLPAIRRRGRGPGSAWVR